jgi:hypothetical protein
MAVCSLVLFNKELEERMILGAIATYLFIGLLLLGLMWGDHKHVKGIRGVMDLVSVVLFWPIYLLVLIFL